MTCIVGIEHKGKVFIGGDSAGVSGYNVTARSDTKVFINGPMVMGFTSSFRMGQILQYSLVVPIQQNNQTDMQFLVTDFIDAVRELYKNKGFLSKDEGQETGGVFLLGYKGKLYRVDSDFQIGRNYQGYDAVGCGEEFALGSLFSTTRDKTAPKKRLIKALEAASHHSGGVCDPFVVLNI